MLYLKTKHDLDSYSSYLIRKVHICETSKVFLQYKRQLVYSNDIATT